MSKPLQNHGYGLMLECVHADTCLPDYWGGHHLPHVAVPVWRGMTLPQIKQAIRDEIRDGAVMGSNDYARLLSADMVGAAEEKQADRVTRAVYAAITRMKAAKQQKRIVQCGQYVTIEYTPRKFFMDLPEEQDGDCPVAYFVFREVN